MKKLTLIISILLLALPVMAQEAAELGTDIVLVSEPELSNTESAGMTKWLIFDFTCNYPTRYEEFDDPETELPVKREVKWIGPALGITMNYDLMQCSNLWVVERSDLLNKFQQLWRSKYNTDRDTAYKDAKLDVVSLDVSQAEGLNRAYNADYMIIGEYDKPSPSEVWVKLSVLSADAPFEEIAVFERTGLFEELPMLARELSKDILNEFGLFPRSGTESYWEEPLTTNLDAYQWLGKSISAGHLGKMISFYERALEQDPEFFATLVEYGKLLYYDKQFEEAFLRLVKTTELAPGFQLAWLRLGNAYYNASTTITNNLNYMMNPDKAPEDWELVDDAKIKNSVDEMAAGDYLWKALEYYEKAVEVDPGYVDGWVSVATTQGQLGLAEESLASWETLIGITDLSDAAYFNLGKSLWNVDNDKALEYFLKVVEINPYHVGGLYNAAALAQALGKGDIATSTIEIYYGWAPADHSYMERFNELFMKAMEDL